jgi:two-component system, chemotaxis family, sensor kinase CheA
MSELASDTLCQDLSPAVQFELSTLRDQRDLYRSLLLSDPVELAAFLTLALQSVDVIRATLRHPTREPAAFRGKIERLQMELLGMEQSMASLQLPTIRSRLRHTASSMQDLMLRAEITGNDLLPSMVLMEELCSHLLVAADSSAVHAPLSDEEWPEDEAEPGEPRAQDRLSLALQQLCDKLCNQHGKQVSLVTMGLEEIPEEWGSALFDLLGQLVRNAVEHGIETPAQRTALTKAETGSLVIEFVDRGKQGYALNVQDDGAGLDAERIAEAAVRLGILSADPTRPLDPSRVINLVFQAGVTTAQDPARRGLGLQIVRDHIQRLQGRLNIAAKRGQYVRFQISLPADADGAQAQVQS